MKKLILILISLQIIPALAVVNPIHDEIRNVDIVIFPASGTVDSSQQCPANATSKTPKVVQPAGTYMDQNLASVTTPAYYVCNFRLHAWSNETLADAMLRVYNITGTNLSACPKSLIPGSAQCSASASNVTANTKICADWTSYLASTRQGSSNLQFCNNPPDISNYSYKVTATGAPNVYLQKGTTKIALPSCSSGKYLELNIPNNINLGFVLTQSFSTLICYQTRDCAANCQSGIGPEGKPADDSIKCGTLLLPCSCTAPERGQPSPKPVNVTIQQGKINRITVQATGTTGNVVQGLPIFNWGMSGSLTAICTSSVSAQ